MPSGTHPRSKPYVCLVVSLAHDNCPKAQGILLSCIHVKDIRKNFKVSGGGSQKLLFCTLVIFGGYFRFFPGFGLFSAIFQKKSIVEC